MNQRGSWEVAEERLEQKRLDPKFMDRYGSIFDSAHGGAYWYSFWAMVMVMANCVVLAAVFAPIVNATLILVIGVVDSVLLISWHPNTVWKLFIQDFYRSMVNLATLSTILGYLQGLVPEGLFTNIFMVLSLLSLFASTMESILRPIVRFIAHARYTVMKVMRWDVSVNTGVGGVAAASAWSIFWGDAGAKATIMAAADGEHDEDLGDKEEGEKAGKVNSGSDDSRTDSGSGVRGSGVGWQADSAAPVPPMTLLPVHTQFFPTTNEGPSSWHAYSWPAQQQASPLYQVQDPSAPTPWTVSHPSFPLYQFSSSMAFSGAADQPSSTLNRRDGDVGMSPPFPISHPPSQLLEGRSLGTLPSLAFSHLPPPLDQVHTSNLTQTEHPARVVWADLSFDTVNTRQPRFL